ncbi:MAG TPA: ABC transporter ATP-binding protein [Euzebyales bacterium]|nr:ABC transporter ATP-binding protein [Euzebyales bacterium]
MSLLQVEHVTKSFAGLVALDDVSLTVEAGSIVGLIGPNGAGKTTLFNVIAGTFAPTAGRVVFDGTDITGWRPHRIARAGLARTFQLMRPFPALSVRSNVVVAALARHRTEDAAGTAADAVLERVGLLDLADQVAGTLPTAGRKRLEVARALALHPRLVLLDEVMAGLLPTERQPVIDLLRDIRDEGTTLLLVEHVMAAVMALSDRVLVLHHGELLAGGTPQQIANDPAVIDAYLGEEMLIADP